jgi:hypothetical protein
MSRLTGLHAPLLGLGMASVVLGLIALMVGFLPVLGIPISAFGLLCGLVGLAGAFFPTGASLRWSVGGVGVCAAALALNLAIAYAPGGEVPTPVIPKPWQGVPDRPSNPPPAESHWFD